MDRVAAIEQLAERRFDLLVIGGGIIGAGIAEAATAHGLSVALVDRGDFAGATSSASSKLIHGGLRYLQMGDVRLVREAHQERRALMNVVAPHLVHRLPFLFPLYRGGPAPAEGRADRRPALLGARAGAAERPGQRRRARCGSSPTCAPSGLHSCALYADAWTNDGRLTIANIRAAADRGAVVVNYAEVTELHGDGATVAVDGELRAGARAARLVNATGPWLDRLRRARGSERAAPSIRLSQGRARDRRRRRGLGGRGDDPAEQAARQLRDPVGRECCSSGRPTRSTRAPPEDARGHRRGRPHDARRGAARRRRHRRAVARVVRRAARAARRAGRRPRTRAARPSTPAARPECSASPAAS